MAGCCRLPQICPRPENALRPYRKGWGIECLFADAETRGFNIGDTRIAGHAKPGNFACGRCIGHDMGVPMRKPCNGPKGHSEKKPQEAREILVRARVRHTAALAVA